METIIQDRISFENEFERVRPTLFKRALRRVRDRDSADDVVQAVAIRAWPNRGRIHPCGMLRYLLRCVDMVAHTTSELGVDLQRALASIRPGERALVLLAAQGYSVAEIADRTQADPNNVRIALHRARVALRVRLAA
jgi:DNA-directed RNA polymerase specialized sigma24 family protein